MLLHRFIHTFFSALGMTITDNGVGKAFIKNIREGSVALKAKPALEVPMQMSFRFSFPFRIVAVRHLFIKYSLFSLLTLFFLSARQVLQADAALLCDSSQD